MAKNKKYVTLPDVRVSYSKADGTVHLTAKDSSLPEGFNLILPRGSKAETQMKVLLNKNEILTDLPKSDLPLRAKLPLLSDIKWNLLPLGVGPKNSPIVWDVQQDPNILIFGIPGSGKTILLSNLLSHVSQFPIWETYRFESTGDQDLHTLLANLQRIESDMNSVYRKMQAEKVLLFTQLSSIPNGALILIDDISRLAPKDYQTDTAKENSNPTDAAEALRIIEHIARIGRAAGVYLVISTHSPDSRTISLGLRENLSVRVAMGSLSAQQSYMVFDKNIASQNIENGVGRGFIAKADYTGQFQAYTPDDVKPS